MQVLWFKTSESIPRLCLFVSQYGKAGSCGAEPQQNRGPAGEDATQPGGHRNAKSTSTRTCAPMPIGSWECFYLTDTNTHPRPSPPAVELRQKKMLSCVQLQKHTGWQTSISSSCDKIKKSSVGWGVGLYRKKAVTFLSTGKWFPFHETARGMYINTAAVISLWQHEEMACCDKTMGGRETQRNILRKSWLFFFFFFCTALNFTRVNKSPKERQIKSAPQPPQFSKTPGPGGQLTRLLLVSPAD